MQSDTDLARKRGLCTLRCSHSHGRTDRFPRSLNCRHELYVQLGQWVRVIHLRAQFVRIFLYARDCIVGADAERSFACADVFAV